jgi:hypothetical protein
VSIRSLSGHIPSRRGALRAVPVTLAVSLVSLLFAAAAESASRESFAGNTSQGQRVTFTISQGKVVGLKYHINDTCPDGHILTEHVTYQPITIHNGKISHTFGPAGQPTSVKATISGTHVSGSITDRSKSPREHALCHGSATFHAQS